MQDGIGSLFDVDDVLCDIVEIDPILVEVLRRYGRMVLSLARWRCLVDLLSRSLPQTYSASTIARQPDGEAPPARRRTD